MSAIENDPIICYFQYPFVPIPNGRCLFRADRIHCEESGNPSTIYLHDGAVGVMDLSGTTSTVDLVACSCVLASEGNEPWTDTVRPTQNGQQ